MIWPGRSPVTRGVPGSSRDLHSTSAIGTAAGIYRIAALRVCQRTVNVGVPDHPES